LWLRAQQTLMAIPFFGGGAVAIRRTFVVPEFWY
jgi:hypothetical protein